MSVFGITGAALSVDRGPPPHSPAAKSFAAMFNFIAISTEQQSSVDIFVLNVPECKRGLEGRRRYKMCISRAVVDSCLNTSVIVERAFKKGPAQAIVPSFERLHF